MTPSIRFISSAGGVVTFAIGGQRYSYRVSEADVYKIEKIKNYSARKALDWAKKVGEELE